MRLLGGTTYKENVVLTRVYLEESAFAGGAQDGRERGARRQILPNRSVGRVVARGCAGLCAIAMLAASLAGQTATPKTAVTEVVGESWIEHLHRDFGDTSMGKTGRLGPAPMSAKETPCWQPNRRFLRDPGVCDSAAFPPEYEAAGYRERTVVLRGSDVYRLNCRGCHGESGLGAPPEINSVINPVRATSVAAIRERMKKVGVDISQADATELAKQSKASLLLRLHNGGQEMPAFAHLNEAEIRSLYAYLKQLAGVAGAESEQITVKESSVRIGEHIVKSTCHTCHSADGANPSLRQLLEGRIPPLSTLRERTTQEEFVRKVTSGAPVMMGAPPQLYRGRMPVFYYLTQEEAADAYLYLSRYSPHQAAQVVAGIAAVQGGGTPRPAAHDAPGDGSQTHRGVANRTTTSQVAARLGLAALLLLVGGIGFTVLKFKLLSLGHNGHRLTATKDEAGDALEKARSVKQISPSLSAGAEDVLAE